MLQTILGRDAAHQSLFLFQLMGDLDDADDKALGTSL